MNRITYLYYSRTQCLIQDKADRYYSKSPYLNLIKARSNGPIPVLSLLLSPSSYATLSLSFSLIDTETSPPPLPFSFNLSPLFPATQQCRLPPHSPHCYSRTVAVHPLPPVRCFSSMAKNSTGFEFKLGLQEWSQNVGRKAVK